MGNFGTSEILIVLVVVLLLFGSAKLPQLARSLGKSVRILKAETKGLREDEETAAQPAAASPSDPRQEAARLREEAARLEREAAAADGTPQRRPLPSGEPIQGVPVSDPNKIRNS
ncbi:Sec-independent protein translocase protein TatA [Actinomadura rubrobrunea]|uniref:Sec-independent protein translocase protein TatA n=1 Tax=Actinomadura rubrobrunea TaxID=115335 RepID=A0A9W6PUV8_9ACTN|nr:Sec-independent protein translocase subunit TatA [Actinomadura rubrobrunea]GLW64934.1 Sec-independent protein translocase protein TatA [Actinomadura rubrobrunea]